MIDKKQVLSIVFGVALASCIVAVFTLFMECVNQITFCNLDDRGLCFYLNWWKFALCYGIPMLTGGAALILLAIGHFKQKECCKKTGTILALITAILLLIVSVIVGFLVGWVSAGEYSICYAAKAVAITGCASFATLYACILIHNKAKNNENN
ncbi:MAG: hypothetical protein IKK20_03495 [Clostridia bacterium]|nr:hypothetical protein [Clostridia bacterium]